MAIGRVMIYAALIGTAIVHEAVAARGQNDDTRLAAEISATEQRLAALQKLAKLRADEAALRKQLGVMTSSGATPSESNSATITAAAPDPAPSASPTPTPSTTPTSTSSPTDFGGLKFGVGVSATLDTGKHDRIGEVEVVNGIVRVKDKNDVPARIMLESHYFFTPDHSFLSVGSGNWGFGPFVALQPGSGEIIDAIGLGVMVGFKRPGSGTESFNVGVGAVIDPNVKVLGDGIVENMPLPPGETEARLRETSQAGILGIVSFSF